MEGYIITNILQKKSINFKDYKYPFFLTAFIFITNFSIFLDIPFLRQLMGIIFLSLIPGMLLLFILKLNKLNFTDKVVLTIGLSIAFLMFFGWVLNQTCIYFGYLTPLAPSFLVAFLSLALLILLFIVCIINKNAFCFTPFCIKLNIQDKLLILLSLTFPILSISGIHLMNVLSNNFFLLILLFLIPLCIIFINLLNRQVSPQVYPIIIFMFSISLVLLWALRGNHLYGWDTHSEYYFFQLTSYNQRWGLFEVSNLNSCLSVTLLPAIYQSFLNINPEYLFKVLYPSVFSISPLVVYLIAKQYVTNLHAFLGSFLFISAGNFLSTTAHSRTNTAILFFALAIMSFFHKDINNLNKKILFIIFSVAVIVSHYSTTYVSFFIFLLTWVGTELFLKLIYQRKIPETINAQSKNTSLNILNNNPSSPAVLENPSIESKSYLLKRNITGVITALFFAILFVWYSQVTSVPFNSGVDFVYTTFTRLQQFFVTESRHSVVSDAAGVGFFSKDIPAKIKFIFNWLTILFMVIGFIFTVWKFFKSLIKPQDASHHQNLINFPFKNFQLEYLILSFVCFIVLTITVLFPYISVGYDLVRIYTQVITVLVVFFVPGCLFIARFFKFSPHWLFLIILIPYFLGQTGVINQFFNTPGSIVLDSSGKYYDQDYIHDQDSSAAKWMVEYANLNKTINTDVGWSGKLRSLMGISDFSAKQSLSFEQTKEIKDYVFLGYHNVVSKKLLIKEYESISINSFKHKLLKEDLLYNNGSAQVWYSSKGI